MPRLPAFLLIATAVLTGVAPLRGADEKPQTKLKPQAELPNLPGPFEVYMVTGKHQDTFHCPVCAHGLRPLVLVFLRDRKEDILTPTVQKFLQKLEKSIADHPLALAGACAIVLDDGGYRNALENKTTDLLQAMQQRDASATALRNLRTANKLQHVTLALDRHAGPQGYKINDKATVTVLVCYLDKIEGRYEFDHEVSDRDGATLEKIRKQFDDITAKVQNSIRPPRRPRR
jgi:hypothetical protein